MLLLQHPEVATRPCGECRKWLYDAHGLRVRRGDADVPRPSNAPTPCWSCPKRSPEYAAHVELSEKNWRTLELFLQTRAMSGQNLVGRMKTDAIVARNFAVLQNVFETFRHSTRAG